MRPVGFEPTIPAGEWPQTYTLDRAATGTGKDNEYLTEIYNFSVFCWFHSSYIFFMKDKDVNYICP